MPTIERPEPNFARIWYISFVNLAILSLPLEHWVQGWEVFAAYYAAFGFGWFLGPELAAPGVKRGFDATKTSFIFWKIKEAWLRIVLGLWMAGVVIWRFPDFLHLNWVIGGYLLFWLPWHYWRPGYNGPLDRFRIWLLARFGR